VILKSEAFLGDKVVVRHRPVFKPNEIRFVTRQKKINQYATKSVVQLSKEGQLLHKNL